MCAVACIYAGIHTPVCVSVLWTDVDIRCLPQSFTAIFLFLKKKNLLLNRKPPIQLEQLVNKPQESFCPHLS